MKLNEIKQVTPKSYNLAEGVIPAHISMTLQQIVDAGKVTNSVQTFILADLSSMYKDGGPYRWSRDLNSYGSESSSAIIDALRQLPDEESVELARWFLEKLEDTSNFESNAFAKPEMCTTDWVRYVLSRQD